MQKITLNTISITSCPPPCNVTIKALEGFLYVFLNNIIVFWQKIWFIMFPSNVSCQSAGTESGIIYYLKLLCLDYWHRWNQIWQNHKPTSVLQDNRFPFPYPEFRCYIWHHSDQKKLVFVKNWILGNYGHIFSKSNHFTLLGLVLVNPSVFKILLLISLVN